MSLVNLVMESLVNVGFALENGRVVRGIAGIEPISSNVDDWKIVNRMYWSGATRYGVFLVCRCDGAQCAFDLFLNAPLVLPKYVLLSTGENGDVLYQLSSGNVFMWNDSRGEGCFDCPGVGMVCFDAESLEDAAFLVESGDLFDNLDNLLFEATTTLCSAPKSPVLH